MSFLSNSSHATTTMLLVTCQFGLVFIFSPCCEATTNGRRSCRTIDAGIRLNTEGGAYFFSGSSFIDYNTDDEVEKGTGPLSRIGLDNIAPIDAAVAVPGTTSQSLIISGRFYHSFNVVNGEFGQRVSHGNIMEDLGIPHNYVHAAFGLRHQMTLITGCDLWTKDTRRTTRRFQKENGTLTGWGIPCDLDAAVTWSYDGGEVILIKGHEMWRLYRDESETDTDVVEGPFHTDGLNICSWFLCGEANFTQPADFLQEDPLTCNGDPRLCPLRLNQVTLAGLHNAGAGFNGGFGLLKDCWLRNHRRTIYQQLKLGIRHLDIDPCFDHCGYLGTCHWRYCGGSICTIIKQTRRFLLEHPGEVVTVNFNHEILEPRRVFRELTRQLKVQLRPLLSSAFRDSGQTEWPTLQDSVRSNKRLFVIYAYIVQNEPHARYYRRNTWIHTEHWLGSTWREIELTPGCSELVSTTSRMCYHRQHRELVEVSSILTPTFFTCVSTIAHTCRPRLMDTLRSCESYRYRHGKSPNVLLVDYPEVDPQGVTSVFHAVYHQNVRNILQHRSSQCRISIGAAVTINDKSFIFSGSKVMTYDFDIGMHTDRSNLPEELYDIDAAYHADDEQEGITVLKDCWAWQVSTSNLSTITRKRQFEPCGIHTIDRIDGATNWNNMLYIFNGCFVLQVDPNANVQTTRLEDWRIPCNINAVMTSQDGASLHIFKNDRFWTLSGDKQSLLEGLITSWNLDAVGCED